MVPSPLDSDSTRPLFDLPPDAAYLNCAYMAPQLRSVTEAGQRAVAVKERPWTMTVEDFFAPAERAARAGFLPTAPAARSAHMLGVRCADGLPDGLSDALRARGVHVSIRGDSIRVSPHVYSSERDLERFLEVLDGAASTTPGSTR